MIATARRGRARGVLVVSGACLVALTLTAALVGNFSADASVRDALLSLAAPGVLAFMRVVNRLGTWPFLAPATIAAVLLLRRGRAHWWLWLLLMIAAPLAEGGLKELVARPRPEGTSMGFPSGHATAVAAYFGALIYLTGELPRPVRVLAWAVAVLAIALVGAARVTLRAHWPSDVLGGIALGLLLAAAATIIASRRASARAARPKMPRS